MNEKTAKATRSTFYLRSLLSQILAIGRNGGGAYTVRELAEKTGLHVTPSFRKRLRELAELEYVSVEMVLLEGGKFVYRYVIEGVDLPSE